MSTTTQNGSAIQPAKSFKPDDYQKKQPLAVLKQMGEAVKFSLADAMPGVMKKNAPALLRALYTECQQTPKLLECTPESLFGCTLRVAQMGLQLGGTLGQAYIIPFKGKATLITGYKGYIQLVNRSGQTGIITAYTVYDKDEFTVQYGTDPKIVHKPGVYADYKAVMERKAIAYYASCKTAGGVVFQSLTKPEAEYHRSKFAMFKGDSGPWATHFDAMAMKTCIIKLCKYLPMSAEVMTAVSMDEQDEAGEPQDVSFLFRDALQIEDVPQPKTESLTNRLAEVKGGNASPADGQLFPGDADYEKSLKADEQKRQHAATV